MEISVVDSTTPEVEGSNALVRTIAGVGQVGIANTEPTPLPSPLLSVHKNGETFVPDRVIGIITL